MIELDTSLPFVASVVAILDGKGDRGQAVELLMAAERRHGVRICQGASLASSLALVDPQRRPTMGEFDRLMTWPSSPPRLRNEAIARRDSVYTGTEPPPDQVFFPFLSEVGLLLDGRTFANGHWLELADGVVSSWTPRGWGELLTAWVRATGWGADQRYWWEGGRTTYKLFATHLYRAIERYEEWASLTLELIAQKCARQYAEVMPVGSPRAPGA